MCNVACIDFARAHLQEAHCRDKRVLEVGALDVNGSVRPLIEALGPASYTGVDLVPGPGVDTLCPAEELLAVFGRGAFDLVICTEMLEHVPQWLPVIVNLKGVLRRNGWLLLTTRSRGFPRHGYPDDFWRFEVGDMHAILADFADDVTQPDPDHGVLFFGRKSTDRPLPLQGYPLYSMHENRRLPALGGEIAGRLMAGDLTPGASCVEASVASFGHDDAYAPIGAFVLHRRGSAIVAHAAVSDATGATNDSLLIHRIVESYRRAAKIDRGAGKSQWSAILSDRNHDIHDALLRGDEAYMTRQLADPAKTDLFYGFDNMRREYTAECRASSTSRSFYAGQIYDVLVRLAEAMGTVALDNPETYGTTAAAPLRTTQVLEAIDDALGVRVDFPNPFPNEWGLETDRGVASYRAVQALYQAWRIRDQLAEHGGSSVVEIGPGLGRTAYYASRLGVERYRLVDIPFSLVSSAYYLGRLLGGRHITLHGEQGIGNRMAFLIPAEFLASREPADLVVNFDSFTEIDRRMANKYWTKIFEVAPLFFSVNHEANSFRVRDFYAATPQAYQVGRAPCWMRRGYVEETIARR